MKETWKVGNHPSVIITDGISQRGNNLYNRPPDPDGRETGYYGGILICESVLRKHDASQNMFHRERMVIAEIHGG